MTAGSLAAGSRHDSKNRKLRARIFKCKDKARNRKLEMISGFKLLKTLCIDLLPLARLNLLNLPQTSPPTADEVFKYPCLGYISHSNHYMEF